MSYNRRGRVHLNVYVQVWVLVSTTSKSPWVSALDTKWEKKFGIKMPPKIEGVEEYLKRMENKGLHMTMKPGSNSRWLPSVTPS